MLIREKSFYLTFYKLSAMIAVQNLLSYGVNLADNIMLGSYNEISLAAAALINQIQYLLQMISMAGIGAGALVIVSQYWGKGEIDPIRRIIPVAMKFAAVAGLLFFSVTFFMPETVLSFLTSDAALRAEGVKYLRIMCFTYITFPLQIVLVTSMRGVRTVSIGPITSAISLLTNIILNYMFIFGAWGAPELGITGAAVATLVARVLELTIVLVYVRVFDRKLRMRLTSFFKPDAAYLADFSKVAIPVMLSGASWGIGMMMQVVILGHISQSIVAANSISATIYQVITALSFGAASASNVMLGNSIGASSPGAGGEARIRQYSRSFQLLYFINGLVAGIVLLVLRDFVLGFYTLEHDTWELTRTFITMLCVVVVFASYQYPVSAGVILGGGNTRYCFIVDTAFIWLCVLPFSALSAFVWKLSPVITFLLLKSDQFLKCIPNSIVVNRYRWVRVLTRKI